MLDNNTVYFLNTIWTYCTCMYYVSEINEYYYYYNNMGCGYAPHGGACPHMRIPLHCQTYLSFMVGTVVSLLAL